MYEMLYGELDRCHLLKLAHDGVHKSSDSLLILNTDNDDVYTFLWALGDTPLDWWPQNISIVYTMYSSV